MDSKPRYFVILKVPGSRLVTGVRAAFLEMTGVSEDEIKETKLRINSDLSGLGEEPSEIVLRDGTKWEITDESVLAAVTSIAVSLASKYEVVGWAAPWCGYWDYRDASEFDIPFVFAKTLDSKDPVEEVIDCFTELIQTDLTNRGLWFNRRSIGRRLVRRLVAECAPDWLLGFFDITTPDSPYPKDGVDKLDKLYAWALIREIPPTAVRKFRPLLEYLMDDDSPLDSDRKKEAAERFGLSYQQEADGKHAQAKAPVTLRRVERADAG